MSIYLTGDIHGNPIERFSFKPHSNLRDLGQNDIMIILGDFGLPFGINAPWFEATRKKDIYNIKWLNSKPWTTIVVCGNHDDRDAIEKMPITKKWGGLVRQMMFEGIVYKNIFIIDCPQVLDIENQHCLVIPGADSHDISSGILDPEDEQFGNTLCKWSADPTKMFRIKHWSWWENEGIDIPVTKALLRDYKDDFFDLILSHDCPALFNEIIGTNGFRENSTEGELFLEELRKDLEFDSWFHGHCHTDIRYPGTETYKNNILNQNLTTPGDNRIMCLYNWICNVN